MQRREGSDDPQPLLVVLGNHHSLDRRLASTRLQDSSALREHASQVQLMKDVYLTGHAVVADLGVLEPN
jgi:hypothetical protein